MAGIVSWGSYIPSWRLRRQDAGEEWGVGLSGETAVAGIDEDALTMGIEAATRALDHSDHKKPQAVYFASCFLPALERNPGALIAFRFGFGEQTRCANFSGSCSAGAEAMLSAMDLIESGKADRALVVIGEAGRKAIGGSRLETTLGSAAVAFLLGNDGYISLKERFYLCDNFPDLWFDDSQGYLSESNFNFLRHKGYVEHTIKALKTFQSYDTSRSDFDHMAYYQSDESMVKQLQKRLQIDPEKMASGRHVNALGDLGSVSPFLSLAMTLEAAKPREKVILCAYGAGTCVFITFDMGAKLNELQVKITPQVKTQIQEGVPISYSRFLRCRKLIKD